MDFSINNNQGFKQNNFANGHTNSYNNNQSYETNTNFNRIEDSFSLNMENPCFGENIGFPAFQGSGHNDLKCPVCGRKVIVISSLCNLCKNNHTSWAHQNTAVLGLNSSEYNYTTKVQKELEQQRKKAKKNKTCPPKFLNKSLLLIKKIDKSYLVLIVQNLRLDFDKNKALTV
jgi:hypothetical protein